MPNVTGEFTYVILWKIFRHLHSIYETTRPDSQRKDEVLALRFGSFSMGFFALEAFLNHIIQTVEPDIWRKERKCFSGGESIGGVKYYGPIGKLEYVHSLCRVTCDQSTEDFNTVLKVKELRDLMAHGRSCYEAPNDLNIDELQLAHPPTSKLFELGTHELLESAVRSFDSFRYKLFDAAKLYDPSLDLGPRPDMGILSMEIISLRL